MNNDAGVVHVAGRWDFVLILDSVLLTTVLSHNKQPLNCRCRGFFDGDDVTTRK